MHGRQQALPLPGETSDAMLLSPVAERPAAATDPETQARVRCQPRNRRRVLLVFPRYVHSFGTFEHAFPLLRVRAFMPPQGLLVIAAYLPAGWEVRFIDENIDPARDADFRWADAVFISGMHVQRPHIDEINGRAHRHGKLTVLGGPSVSACPEWYRDVDLLHVGELGTATDDLITRLDSSVTRPPGQEVYEGGERLPLGDFPCPAYHLLDLGAYFLGSVQYSSGCPYRCEFCDIPELYGRNPRFKRLAQLTAELDALVADGRLKAVYFVDDNFIGNRHAARDLLQELVRWQERRGYPLRFSCEATLNIAQAPDLLELMREAGFTTVFCGIETPEERALQFMHKEQNLRQPILEAVRTLNHHGLEVVAGIIFGLDTDSADTGRYVDEFIAAARIPLLTINILHALPKTPLWRRLEAAGRLLAANGRESNVDFLLPYDTVVGMWRRCIAKVYDPEEVYGRFEHQMQHTYPNRKRLSARARRRSWAEMRRGLATLLSVVWHVGLRADYRRCFWRMALAALRRGQIEELIQVAVVAHHLIQFSRECLSDRGEKCFYSPGPAKAQSVPDEAATSNR